MNLYSSCHSDSNNLHTAIIICVLLLTLLVRSSTVEKDLPYFYNEDEAHHFNRVAEMVAQGRYNPEYFHKPSLHFYLRMPVHAASFLVGVRQGYLRKIEEIETKNRHGLGGWSLTASHPHTVKWQRAFSLLLSCFTIILSMMTVALITSSTTGIFITGIILALSPALFERSVIVGVDTPMGLFCSLSIYLAVKSIYTKTTSTIVLSAFSAGLAISTKYNALPIALTPLFASIVVCNRSLQRLTLALGAIIIGFFLGSPFILPSLPLFLNHFAYEIWHYGVAGHAGHMTEPGIAQLTHYLKYFASDGLGIVALLLAALGTFSLAKKDKAIALIAFSFPFFFLALMVAQKTNFERNMDAAIAPISILSGLGASFLLQKFKSAHLASLILVLAVSIQPLWILTSKHTQQSTESREEVIQYLTHTHSEQTGRTAASASLWLPKNADRYERIDFEAVTFLELLNRGFDTIICMPHEELCNQAKDNLPTVLAIDGVGEKQRIVENPSLRVLAATSLEAKEVLFSNIDSIRKDAFTYSNADSQCQSAVVHGESEKHCWVGTRVFNIDTGNHQKFEIYSPWTQTVQLTNAHSQEIKNISLKAGTWTELELEANSSWVGFAEIVARAGKKDTRELALAVRFR